MRGLYKAPVEHIPRKFPLLLLLFPSHFLPATHLHPHLLFSIWKAGNMKLALFLSHESCKNQMEKKKKKPCIRALETLELDVSVEPSLYNSGIAPFLRSLVLTRKLSVALGHQRWLTMGFGFLHVEGWGTGEPASRVCATAEYGEFLLYLSSSFSSVKHPHADIAVYIFPVVPWMLLIHMSAKSGLHQPFLVICLNWVCLTCPQRMQFRKNLISRSISIRLEPWCNVACSLWNKAVSKPSLLLWGFEFACFPAISGRWLFLPKWQLAI